MLRRNKSKKSVSPASISLWALLMAFILEWGKGERERKKGGGREGGREKEERVVENICKHIHVHNLVHKFYEYTMYFIHP